MRLRTIPQFHTQRSAPVAVLSVSGFRPLPASGRAGLFLPHDTLRLYGRVGLAANSGTASLSRADPQRTGAATAGKSQQQPSTATQRAVRARVEPLQAADGQALGRLPGGLAQPG